MSNKESWRCTPTPNFLLACLIIFSFGVPSECQDERPKAFAAPTGLNALDVDGSSKSFFKIGATRDGITRAIADEVSPGINLQFPPNSPQDSPAYDDNLIEAAGEEELFIPSIYRNETEKEKEEKKKASTTTTTRAPPTTTTRRVNFGRETLLPAFTSRPPLPQTPVQLPPAVQNRPVFESRPRIPPPARPPQVLPQTRPPPVFVPQPTRPPPPAFVPQQTRPPPPVFVPQPTRPPPPAPVFQTRPPPVFQTRPPPPQFQTRAPFQQPQPQPLPAFRPPQPPAPLQPQTLPAFQQPPPPPQSFIPQLRPVQQPRRPPQIIQTTPRPIFTQPPTQAPFQPQTFRPRPQPQQQQQPTPAPRPLRPFRPAGGRPFRPRQRPQDPTGLRTGFCPFTIFYQSGPASAFESQQTFSHFASVVSVDQCARTCHEFNCQSAFFDSANRHCQFNPGQSAPQTCPSYPSPFLRNNVPLSAVPLKITCITCQRRRRINRINSRVFTNRFGQTRRQFTPQVVGRSVANVLHGVLIRQPQSVAIGFGPTIPREDSFHSSELAALSEKLVEEEKVENSEKFFSSKEDDEEETTQAAASISADLIPLKMHKLSSSEASEESKEVLSSIEARISTSPPLEVVDSSYEGGEEEPKLKAAKLPLPSSSTTTLKKYLHKSAGLIKTQRISAADKPLESSEDSSNSFA